MKFKVEWLEGYGEDVEPKICTMENFVSEDWNLDAYWGDDGMIQKLRELLTSEVGQKVTLANFDGEHVVATKVTMVDKPTISKEAFVEIYSTIGEAWLEDAYLGEHIWNVDDPENIVLTERAQDQFNSITDQLEGILRQFVKVEGDQ